MAPLTWRNVDSPSFASSNDMYRIAAGLMNSGFDAANAGIDRFRQTTMDEQSAALMASVMGASSPQAIQAAVGNANPAFLSADALRFANAQPGVLAQQAQAQQTIRANDYNYGRNQVLDDRADTAWQRSENAAIRAEEIALVDHEKWTAGLPKAATAEQIVTRANAQFGAQGQAAVIAQIQNLAGKGLYSDDIVQLALDRVNGQSILPSVGSNALTGVAGDLGIGTGAPAARQYDTGWAAGADVTGTGSPAPASLVQNESGGDWAAQNDATGAGGQKGHFGRLQFGKARLQDAMNAGVIPQGMTPEQFMASPQTQLAVENWHFADIDKNASDAGLDQYYGQTIGGVVITPESIRAMAHLGGFGGAQKFIETGGQYNPADENGTRLSDYGQKHGLPGTGGPTRANAEFMNQTGVNPLTGSGVSDLLNQAALLGGPRRTVSAEQTALDTAAATSANGGRPQTNAAGNPVTTNSPETEQAIQDIARAASVGAVRDAVTENLARTGQTPESTIALPTPDELLREAASTPANQFPEVDPNATAYVQAQQTRARESTINNAIAELTNSTGGGALSPVTNSVNGLLDYFSQTPATAAANAEQRTTNDAAGTILADNSDFFRQNPEEIAVARANPVQYAQNFGNTPAQKAFLDARGGTSGNNTPAAATAEEATPRSDMTPQERVLADRTDSLAPLSTPSVLASANPNVPIGDVLNTLIAQGTADQTANIYGALDRLVANPPTEGTDPESVARAMFNAQDGLGAGEKINYNDILNGINTLMQSGGVTAPMAGEILKYSTDTGGRDWTPNRWFGGNKQINMDTAEATRKAYLGTKPDGTVNTAPATRALERAQQVQTAMTNLQNLKAQYEQVIAAVKAASVDPAYSDTMREDLAQTAEAILEKIREDTQKIEATGILSNYSARQSN